MLSAEQQQIIQDSVKIVNTVLKRMGIKRNEDLRQEAILHLCKRIDNFDPKRNTKWSTYAYKITETHLKTILGRQSEKDRHFTNLSSCVDNPDDFVVAKGVPLETALYRILETCTDEEKEIVRLRVKGYKIREIGEMYGQHRHYISKKLRNIKEKLLKNA